MQQWPLDSSFRLILETWLSFIQPWRYTDFRNRGRGGGASHNPEEDKLHVDVHWLSFIAENLLAYTEIFQQLLPRFSRINLSMPKNAQMLYRVTKVFNQHLLNVMLSEVERSLETPGSYTDRLHLKSPLVSHGHKWSAIVRQQILELEGPGFVYEPMFSHKTTALISQFIMIIQEARQTAQHVVNVRELERLKQSTSFFSWIKELFIVSTDTDEYSLEERQKVLSYLDSSREHLLNIFQLDASQIPEYRHTTPPASPCSEVFRTPDTSMHLSSDDSSQRVQSSWLTPQNVQRKHLCLNYEGDPDLQPIKSSEIAVLVRLLYQVSSKLNEMYGVEIFNVYHRTDLWGRISQQVIQPPLRIRFYDKSVFCGHSPVVEKVLPPRLSLRSLASREKVILLFLFMLVMLFLFGYGPVTSVICLLWGYVMFVFIKAVLGPLFGNHWTQSRNQNDQSLRLDESFNEQSFLSS